MTDRSLAQAPAPTTLDALMERIERELKRLKRHRPELEDRISRAEHIILTHLTCRRQRVILVRVRHGRPRVLVNGAHGAVYVVDPSDWTCSCPDHHRRDATCKHALAVYALARSARPVPKLPACVSCQGRFPHSELIEVTHDDGSLSWFPGDLLCKACVLAGALA